MAIDIMDIYFFKKKWLLPLIIFEVYLALTVFLFYFGPWPWPIKNPLVTFTYLFFSQIFICVGYLLSWYQLSKYHKLGITPAIYGKKRLRYLRLALLVSLALLIPTSLSRTGDILPNIIEGLKNAGVVYNVNHERLQGGNSFVFIEYVRMALSPLWLAVFPLTIVCWRSLTLGIKILCILVILFNLIMYVATGTNKGIADALITLPWFLYLAFSLNPLKLSFSRGKLALIGIGLTFLFILFLQFFGEGQLLREGGVGEFGVVNTGLTHIYADKTHAFSSILGDDQVLIFESITRYLTSGYYALSATFNIEHDSTFGFGHSMFLARNMDALMNTTYFTWHSLPGVLEQQDSYSMFGLWHSIYPWLASDVGFFGALFIIGIFSYLLGLTWGLSLLTLAPQILCLLYLLLILFFYIPANNQIFQSGETCIGFFLLLLSEYKLLSLIKRHYFQNPFYRKNA
jgi:hypothetical protein